MLNELDFTKEKKNIEDFRTNSGEARCYRGLCIGTVIQAKKRVLIMEYLKGVPLVDLEGIKQYTNNPEQTLITALQTWASSVVNCNSFHADLHGGNVLVLEDGRVGFLDFGIVGKIPSTTWNALNDIISSFALNDWSGVARALVALGATDAENRSRCQ